MNEVRIQRQDAVLVLIDVQEKLIPSMHGGAETERTIVKLIQGCRLLDVPVLATQQYTKGLGPTTAACAKALTEAIDDVPETVFAPIEKTSFSAMGEPAFVEAIKATGRKTVMLAGVEAHVCVLQTAIDMALAGYSVFVILDCIASRTTENKEIGQVRMAQAGVSVAGYETALFELLETAKDPRFKQISAIVK